MGVGALLATVRDAKSADATGIAAIGRAALPETFRDLCDPVVIRNIVEQSYSLDALTACIARCQQREDAHFLVAEMAGQVVGFLHYDCEGVEPELHRIYIEPALKRRGIGSALMDGLNERLAPGSTYILMVIAGNLPAVAFYQKHGLTEQAKVDGPTYMSEHMSVSFPRGTLPAPALVLRFTKADVQQSRRPQSKGGIR